MIGASNSFFTELRNASSVFSFFPFGAMTRLRVHSPRLFLLLTISFLMPVATALGAEQNGDIRILRSDGQSLVFEYTPRYTSEQTIKEGTQELTVFDFDGSVPPHEMIVGQPDLRSRWIALGFPDAAGNGVQLVASDYEEIPNVLLAPVPSLRHRDGMIEVRSYEPDQVSYSTGRFIPGNVVDLTEIGQSRSLLVGSVKISPVQYNPVSRTVRRYSRMVIEVVFGKPAQKRGQAQDEPLLRGVLLNYDVARNWSLGRPLAKTAVSSVLAQGFWYKIPVSAEGVYLLDAAYLRASGLDPADIDPRTIKIYGNGGGEVPELITATRPTDLNENAIFVQGEGDGFFHEEDFIVFYGKHTRGWTYNPSTKLFNHYIHHYSDVNYYWLTYSGVTGKRMQQQPSLTDQATVVPDRFTGLVLVDEDTISLGSSGKDWFGPTVNANASITYTNLLPGLIASSPRTYRYSLVARSIGAIPTFVIEEGSTVIDTETLAMISTNDEYTFGTKSPDVTTISNVLISNNTSQLTFTLNTNALSGSGWLNWLEIQYPRSFSATANYLRFRSPDTNGVSEYRLTGFTQAPLILDVTNSLDPKIITGATGSYTFRASSTAGTISEYCAVAAGAYKVPGAMQFVTNQDLRGITEGYDFIIATSKEFKSAADRLAAHREDPKYGNLRTIVIDVDMIYNEFSGGLPDVTAIRDFLKHAYDTWTRQPNFVLFFGQGTYDYKARLGFRSNYVPTWQSAESLQDLSSYATDDFFAKFGTTASPSLVTGRLNARTSAEADLLVDKTIAYDQSSAHDPWKMRILFVADDSWTPEREDGSIHTSQAESLAESTVPGEFEKRKIYIAEYPTVITAQGRRKPGAYQAIIDEVNRGCLVVNYTGHGNPSVWAHESIFTVQTSIPELVNADRLAIFYLATCNFSQFDDPNRYTGAELLMNKADGGAIGVVSATRKVFAGENYTLNRDIYTKMFLRDQFTRVVMERPATALFQAKIIGNSVNDQKFFHMGDPTVRLQYPSGYASIDTINGEPVDTVQGVPRASTDPIQVRALQKVTVKGSLRDGSNNPDSITSGTATLVVNDATRRVTIAGFPPGSTIPFSYLATGGTVFRGSSSVSAGEFASTFLVPKDISYADSTTRGRLVAYYSNGTTDGAAYTGKIYVGGTDTSAAPDASGPTISLYLDSKSFRSGDLVSDDPMLLVDLADSSGINTSLSGIGHRIETWLNESSQSIDITDFYTSALDDYQRGTVQYQLRELPYGRNTVRVRAWDAFNNAATAETFFEVTSSEKLTITDVMNYPNPFSRETSFTFRQNQLVPLNISIKIYTLAGRLIQSIETSSPGDPFIQVPWDGRDRDGDVLANGVYLYKVIVSTVDGRFASEALGKLSVLK